jgi:hypothetical protein
MNDVMCAVHTRMTVKKAPHTEIISVFLLLFSFNFKITESFIGICGAEFLSWHSVETE